MKAPIIDVLIIGAGPAGLMAAKQLQDKGIDFLVLEAQSVPRSKVCADVLTSKAIRELDLAFPHVMSELRSTGALQPIWGTVLQIEERPAVDIPFRSLNEGGGPSCYAIDRKSLDMALWNDLSSSNPERLRAGMRVTKHARVNGLHRLVLQDGSTLDCRACIVATGSVMPSFLREVQETKEVDRHTAIGLRGYYKDLDLPQADRSYLFLDRKWMPGGFYIAPLADGVYNVNMVIRKDRMVKENMDLRQEMESAIASVPALVEIFAQAKSSGDIKGSPLKLATLKRPLSVNGLLLIGDAAGLIDLISANGIPQALISGRLAAGSAIAILEGQDEREVLDRYTHDLMVEISSEIKLGRKLSPLLGQPWISTLILSGLGKMASSGLNERSAIEKILYAEDPFKELLRSLNPLTG